ncbi:helix-turn-helix domain-containing protein [soil metagenome]
MINETAKVHRAMADPSRVRILEVLAGSDTPLDIQQLSRALGLHASTVRAHLDVLADAELVTSTTQPLTSGPGRPKLLYTVTDTAPRTPDSGYRFLAEMLASHMAGTLPDPAASALEAGTAWGSYLIERPRPGVTTSESAAVEAIRNFMDRMGFDPEIGPQGKLRLRRCPFLDVAKAHQDVVCSAHLGILQGALAALNTNVTAESIEPFLEPTLCLAQLSTNDSPST